MIVMMGVIEPATSVAGHTTNTDVSSGSAARATLVAVVNLALAGQARVDLAGVAALLEEGASLSAEAGDDASVACSREGLVGLAARRPAARRTSGGSRGHGRLHLSLLARFAEGI